MTADGQSEGEPPDLRSPEITKWQSETIETLEPQRDGANDQRQYHNAGEPRFDTARQRSRFGNKRRKNRSPHANKEADVKDESSDPDRGLYCARRFNVRQIGGVTRSSHREHDRATHWVAVRRHDAPTQYVCSLLQFAGRDRDCAVFGFGIRRGCLPGWADQAHEE